MAAREECFELFSALLKWPFQQRCARLAQEAIERHEGGRRFVRQLADAALGRMQTHLQCVERELFLCQDDQLAVQDEVPGRKCEKVLQHLWKESRQGLSGFGLDLRLVVGPEGEAAKAVPFRFELPAGLSRQFFNQLCLHGRESEWN